MLNSYRNRVAIIANPISGRGKGGQLIPHLAAELTHSGFSVESHLTQKKGDAFRYAYELADECATLLPVGGDGTLNEVINGICYRQIVAAKEQPDKLTPVAPVPVGLSNCLCMELGIKPDPTIIANCIREQTLCNINLGIATTPAQGNLFRLSDDPSQPVQRFFISIAGAGWDASIVHSIAKRRKSHLGFAGYVKPIARSLLKYKFPKMQVEVDSDRITETAELVILGNIKRYGGPFKMTPRADATESTLDLCILENCSPANIATCFLGALFGDHTKHRTVTYLKGRRITISAAEEVPIQIDGEAAGFLPCEFSSPGIQLPVIAPLRK